MPDNAGNEHIGHETYCEGCLYQEDCRRGINTGAYSYEMAKWKEHKRRLPPPALFTESQREILDKMLDPIRQYSPAPAKALILTTPFEQDWLNPDKIPRSDETRDLLRAGFFWTWWDLRSKLTGYYEDELDGYFRRLLEGKP